MIIHRRSSFNLLGVSLIVAMTSGCAVDASDSAEDGPESTEDAVVAGWTNWGFEKDAPGSAPSIWLVTAKHGSSATVRKRSAFQGDRGLYVFDSGSLGAKVTASQQIAATERTFYKLTAHTRKVIQQPLEIAGAPNPLDGSSQTLVLVFLNANQEPIQDPVCTGYIYNGFHHEVDTCQAVYKRNPSDGSKQFQLLQIGTPTKLVQAPEETAFIRVEIRSDGTQHAGEVRDWDNIKLSTMSPTLP